MADNTRACCRNCRFFDAPRSMLGLYPSVCRHPNAQKFDRVMGWASPVVTDPDEGRNDTLLSECNANGWHEPPRLRERFVRWLGDPIFQVLVAMLLALFFVAAVVSQIFSLVK